MAHRYNWKYSTFAAWMISARGGVYFKARLLVAHGICTVQAEKHQRSAGKDGKGRILRLLKILGIGSAILVLNVQGLIRRLTTTMMNTRLLLVCL